MKRLYGQPRCQKHRDIYTLYLKINRPQLNIFLDDTFKLIQFSLYLMLVLKNILLLGIAWAVPHDNVFYRTSISYIGEPYKFEFIIQKYVGLGSSNF